jgi:hypothetical protein
MANAKTLPVDDMLREFRIRALTTPPSAIEMTTLDKAMSQILSKTDIPKEAKIQMYNEALNQFRSVRDTVMQKNPVDLNSHLKSESTSGLNRVKKEWNIQNIPKDLDLFLDEFKEHARHVFINDNDDNIFLGNKKLGTTEQLKKTMEYLFSVDPQFLLGKSKNYLAEVKPELLMQVANVAKDVFDDLNVPLGDWKSVFPRIHQITRHWVPTMSPLSSSPAASPNKKDGSPLQSEASKKSRLSGIPFKPRRMEIAVDDIPADIAAKAPAESTRSRTGVSAMNKHPIRGGKMQKGKGVRNPGASLSSPHKSGGERDRYKINFEKWNNQFTSISDSG